MAIFYIDHTNGNDANDGSSGFPWKTITSGATAARIAPGDEIRLAKTPDPVSVGINATFTDGSSQLTLSSAVNKTIHKCESNMTANTNITCALNTTSNTRREGSNSQAVTPASGFTTGKAAYFTLPSTLNLSGYQILNYWLRTSTSVGASTVTIKLCSDNIGDTPVDSFTLAEATQLNTLMPIVLDKGSAMGSSINSIAIYFDADPGTTVFYFDMFFASKAPGSDSLTLKHFVSKNSGGQGGSEPFCAIAYIDDTTLQLDGYSQAGVGTGAYSNYSGVTETVTLYTRTGVTFDFGVGETVQDSGTAGSLITFSGGGDIGAATQNGETFFDLRNGATASMIFTNGNNYIKFDKIELMQKAMRFHETNEKKYLAVILEISLNKK